ncbi:ubiquinol-cytochrome c reductase complex core protein 2 [Lentinula edodes]|uniref:Cytochrome b-c1 complex subunit 2, mitochondrial n=1 Tax=Lentinula edodes TaxID=5353 RepID=A0A1Q3ERT0_LENED|nr:ubiquinol-cytochrome c reductase complex core protein 2 [Lentinula edodes]
MPSEDDEPDDIQPHGEELQNTDLEELRDSEFPGYFSERDGRLYQADTVTSPYPLPVDTPENQRHSTLHKALKELIENNYIGPVQEVLALQEGQQKVAIDLGCGIGEWVMEMAKEFPQVSFYGLDSRLRTATPMRISVDLLHARAIFMTVRDYSVIVQEAARILKPGGIFLSGEWGQFPAFHPVLPEARGNPGDHVPGLDRFYRMLPDVLARRGIISPVASTVHERLSRSGAFTDIHEHVYYMPIGPWSPDPMAQTLARASSRTIQRVARNFATVVDSAGIKVAAVDNNQPTTSVTFLIKAGSRFEHKAGVAHGLKNFAFKSSAKRTALGTVRESEIYGGVLSASLSREHLALTAEFLRGDEQYFVDVLASFVTSGRFTRHEYAEYVAPVVESEIEESKFNPGFQAIEAAHAVAFHNGLGSSLLASPHNSITHEDIRSFAQSAFTRDNIAVLGTGIDQATLASLVEQSLSKISATSQISSSASSYFGGETRLPAHGGPQTVFVGFGSAGAPTPEIAALSAYLSPTPSVKWSKGSSPIAATIPEGTTVEVVHLSYSDASLFGLLVQGPSGSAVKEAGKAAVQALKTVSNGLKGDDLKKALSKAKFTAASAVDSREGLVSILGSKVLSGHESSLDTTLASFDKVSEITFAKAASTLVKVKPVFVAVGDVATLPYADELGL